MVIVDGRRDPPRSVFAVSMDIYEPGISEEWAHGFRSSVHNTRIRASVLSNVDRDIAGKSRCADPTPTSRPGQRRPSRFLGSPRGITRNCLIQTDDVKYGCKVKFF